MGAIRYKKLPILLAVLQVIFLVLFAFCVDYDESADASHAANNRDLNKNGTNPNDNMVKHYYPMFQDVHVMIFVGFGFLMTFLRRYGYGSVGFNMVIASIVIQWALLVQAFLHHGKGHVGIIDMLTSDFTAAAVLITFGALLGKTSPLQLVVCALVEVVIFKVNEHIGLELLKVADVGGSMFVHVFGAYFGLAACRVLFDRDVHESKKEGSVYHSDIFSMIGTIFLWLFWPSFNSALAAGDAQHRAVINTYLALAACCVVAFLWSAMLDERGRFDMVHVQNATLAGGVAVGTSADMMIHPWGAIFIGCLAGTLSVFGFKYLTPFLATRLKIHDTCGVNNLHGMPGLLAGICGCIVAAFASVQEYGYGLYRIFPARAPVQNSTELIEISKVFSLVEPGLGRSAGMQAAFQIIALLMTVSVAVVSGAITGFILRLPFLDPPRGSHMFDDTPFWQLPDDFEEESQDPERPSGEERKDEHLLNSGPKLEEEARV